MTGAADTMSMAVRERADFADFLETLTPEQWAGPTLCAQWTVRELVAHAVSYDELGWPRTLRRFVRGRFRAGVVNQLGIDEYPCPPEQLIAILRANLRPRGLPAAFGGMIALLDATIHHQDIRRPLGLTREIPPERLRRALHLSLRAPPIRGFQRSRGVTLVATDVGWRHGRGPEVRGPGEAVLMAIAGRREALAELTGPGLPVLTARR
ncbi:maleylpyruvate isomerase family mycothiol-dependent enzyme [Amycolatopsis albispora]|uniref:DinB family protein n=1 Tax=Amycolatopsis albispora TaxID=1804986 RepID=A0A344LET4_9PSEU|nr:maleylpyruvate isomerase family mycothiol-dependent enzyme [Amycolatopsis albispora]AXB46558.1 DinB family protein [Amycolatopsis albispora]